MTLLGCSAFWVLFGVALLIIAIGVVLFVLLLAGLMRELYQEAGR